MEVSEPEVWLRILVLVVLVSPLTSVSGGSHLRPFAEGRNAEAF